MTIEEVQAMLAEANTYMARVDLSIHDATIDAAAVSETLHRLLAVTEAQQAVLEMLCEKVGHITVGAGGALYAS